VPPPAELSTAPTQGRSGSNPPSMLGSWWMITGLAVAILLVLGWRFIADPSLSAPTRDPAWYTWRANVILQSDPSSVVGEWGPGGLFSGGYRVTVPLAGAVMQRVAGIDSYTFSALMMVGIPVLTGLALGAGAFRSRGDPLVVLTTMLATAALFLTTPYVGYLDNITVLFLLALMLPFLQASRISWGARSALFLIGVAAAFTHPTTCVLFGVVLVAIFGFHVLTSRFSLAAALRSDGPMLMSVGSGMVFGLAMWLVGIWGRAADLAEAALPPPYTKRFFVDRLVEWVRSMQPMVIVPFMVVAVVSTVLLARRSRRPAHLYDLAAIWWMLPVGGVLTFLAGSEFQVSGDPGSPVVPYYRFLNATAAPMALVGLGAFAAIRWFLRSNGRERLVGLLMSVLVVCALGWVLVDGLQHRWVTQSNQWANQAVRTSLSAVHEVVVAAGERPNVLVVNYDDTDIASQRTNTAYGWAKTYSNVFRTGLPGEAVKYSATYLGTVTNFLADVPTTGPSEAYTETARSHFDELQVRRRTYPAPPVVFLIGQYYGGLCNGVSSCTDEVRARSVAEATDGAIKIGSDVYVVQGPGLYTPDVALIDRARDAGSRAAAQFLDHPPATANPGHNVLVLAALFLLVVLPGLIAAPWFELTDTPSRIALIPGISIVLSLLSGIAVLAVWRGPLTTAKGWATVAVSIAVATGLRLGAARIRRPLDAASAFFGEMFAAFSNRDFATLVGVQFLVQAGQGMVQGAIGKSIAFGGEEGFDVSTVPSASYLLKVVLALYIPYTFVSPFIGVVIDRFERRRVVRWSIVAAAAVVVAVAVGVLIPLGDATSEGKVGATVALIVGLLAAQAVVRVVLAVKSAALPDVLAARDLLQGNGLSQAGGALFQVAGLAVALGASAALPAWLVVLAGASVLVVGAVVGRQLRHVEAAPHEASFATEASRVLRTIAAGLREVARRPAAALGLSAFQMLRYQFWGFGLFTFALYAKNLVEGGDASSMALAVSGGGGLLGGALGMVLAQRWKDRVPPVRLLLTSMGLLGAGTLVFGGLVSTLGFAAMLFTGSFSFFLGKISADTIVQQSMPDDFRGRAFALFDIAYNLGFIVPALVLSWIWVEGSTARVRTILMASGAVFLLLTLLVASWARRIRGEFLPPGGAEAVARQA
jgi:MFS transporter